MHWRPGIPEGSTYSSKILGIRHQSPLLGFQKGQGSGSAPSLGSSNYGANDAVLQRKSDVAVGLFLQIRGPFCGPYLGSPII